MAKVGNSLNMRIAIVGSRDFSDKQQVYNYVLSLPKDTTVVSGGCRGPDSWAVEKAKEIGISFEVYEADWTRYGLSAGPKRNSIIAKNCDRLVAFWNGSNKSKGTLDVIAKAKANKVPVDIYTILG
jgi:hypothetical protein